MEWSELGRGALSMGWRCYVEKDGVNNFDETLGSYTDLEMQNDEVLMELQDWHEARRLYPCDLANPKLLLRIRDHQ